MNWNNARIIKNREQNQLRMRDRLDKRQFQKCVLLLMLFWQLPKNSKQQIKYVGLYVLVNVIDWYHPIGRSRYGWVVMLFCSHYQSTVFEPRHQQTSRITRTMYTDYVWHTSALVASQCVRGTQVIEWRNSTSGRFSVQSYS